MAQTQWQPSGYADADAPPLASWSRRFVAWYIDLPIVGVAQVLVTWWVTGATFQFDFDEDPFRGVEPGDAVAAVACAALVSLAYHLVFLRCCGATPGKLLLGMRVHRHDSSEVTFALALRRWVVQYAVFAVGFLPWLAAPASLYLLGDALWALRDARDRTWHDLAARTEVVRTTRS